MGAAQKPRIVDVDASNADDFLAYSAAHGLEHDDSYVMPDELERFDPATEPAAIALDTEGAVIGAASVMVEGYVTEGLARFRILHATDPSCYPGLIERMLERLPEGVIRAFLFLPEHPGEITDALSSAGFVETRRAYVLAHTDPGTAASSLMSEPSETTIVQALPTVAEDWANIVNAAFRGEPGRFEMTTPRARELLAREHVIPEGTLIAYKGGSPAGLVLTIVDPNDVHWAEIETLGVLPSEQGKGLGRLLLKHALAGAARNGYTHVSLSVSTTNRRAMAMYLDTGFHAADERVCWQLQVRPEPELPDDLGYLAEFEGATEPQTKIWDFTTEESEPTETGD